MASRRTPTLKELDMMREEQERAHSRHQANLESNTLDWDYSDLGGGFGEVTHEDLDMDWDYYELGGGFGEANSLYSEEAVEEAAKGGSFLSDFKISEYSSFIAQGANQIGKKLQETNFGPRASAYAVAEKSEIDSIAGEALSNTQEPWQETNVRRWQNAAMDQLGQVQAENQNKLTDYRENVELFDGLLDLGYAIAPILGPEAELAYAGFDLAAKALFSPSKPEMSTVDFSKVEDNSVQTHGSFFSVETPQDVAASREINTNE